MPEPVSLVDRLEAVRGWILVVRDGSRLKPSIELLDGFLATLDDAIEALHPVHGE